MQTSLAARRPAAALEILPPNARASANALKIARLERLLAEARAIKAEALERVAQLEQSAASVPAAANSAAPDFEALKTAYEGVINSRSFRYTAPIRGAARLARQLTTPWRSRRETAAPVAPPVQPPATTAIHAEDFIYRFFVDHFTGNEQSARQLYLEDGERSARMLRGVLSDETSISPDSRFSMLEFASGYGCVTRHLKNALPSAEIVACDIHPQAMDFIDGEIGMPTLLSANEPENLRTGRRFNVVFALSFFSHMPRKSFTRWLAALYEALEPGGYLLFTTHGEISIRDCWKHEMPLSADGFYFEPMSEQHDLDKATYGTAICTRGFVETELRQKVGAELSSFRDGFWWRHQDLYIVQKPHRRGPVGMLKDRLWRLLPKPKAAAGDAR